MELRTPKRYDPKSARFHGRHWPFWVPKNSPLLFFLGKFIECTFSSQKGSMESVRPRFFLGQIYSVNFLAKKAAWNLCDPAFFLRKFIECKFSSQTGSMESVRPRFFLGHNFQHYGFYRESERTINIPLHSHCAESQATSLARLLAESWHF